MIIHHETPPGIYCAIPSLRADVAGIEYAETGYHRWIAVNARTLKVYRWKSYKAAFAGITALIKSGQILAVGIAQIKTNQFYRYRVSLSTALSPCGAAHALSNALQENISWATGAGFGIGHRFAAAASGYTSGQLTPPNLQTTAYVQTAMYGRELYMQRY